MRPEKCRVNQKANKNCSDNSHHQCNCNSKTCCWCF
uniref:Uncharacterized protein n=1 Tax=Anguilla anguilla TaxID=7936 RepID=A0A0E9SZA6_ANGAN